jgi:hypothetical protein
VNAAVFVGGIVGLIVVAGGTASAVDFPGRVSGADVMVRNGELLSVAVRAGYLWRLPAEALAGLGMAATAGFGLGGVSGGAGPIAMFRCIHAFGCTSLSVEAKAFRPALLSTWDHATRIGPELALGLYVFKVTAAVYRNFGSGPTVSVSAGAGIQFLF